MYNKALHSDRKKRRGFRYATATPLLAAGELGRYLERQKRVVFYPSQTNGH